MKQPTGAITTFFLLTVLTAGAAAQSPPLGPAEREALSKLQSAKPAERRAGVERLGVLKSRGAAPELAKAAAADPDPSVRRAAVVALGRVRDKSHIPDMILVLEDPDPKVRAGAVEGLVNLYLERDEGFFTRVRSTVVRVVPFWDERQTLTVEPYDPVDARVTRALAGAMRGDAEPNVRVAAVRALGVLGARSELDAMADAMAADARLRPEVLDAFVLIGDPSAVSYVIPFFESPDSDVAAQAMVTAGRLRSPRAVVPLLTAYGSSEQDAGVIEKVKRRVTFTPERRKAALQGLALLGDPRAEDVFYRNLSDKDAQVRRAAYEGLAREGDPRFFDMVSKNILTEKNESVRLAQYFALYKMKHPEVFGRIAGALGERSQREQASEYILEADSPEHLLPYLRTPDREVQRVIVNALGRIGDRSIAEQLRPFARGATPEIALATDRAIRRIEWRIEHTASPAEPAGASGDPAGEQPDAPADAPADAPEERPRRIDSNPR